MIWPNRMTALILGRRTEEVQGDIRELANSLRLEGCGSIVTLCYCLAYGVDVLKETYKSSRLPYVVNAMALVSLVLSSNLFFFKDIRLDPKFPEASMYYCAIQVSFGYLLSFCRTADKREECLPLALVWVLISGVMSGLIGASFLIMMKHRDMMNDLSQHACLLTAGGLTGTAASLALKLRRMAKRPV